MELETRERHWIQQRIKEGCEIHNHKFRREYESKKPRESTFKIKKHLFEDEKPKINFTDIPKEFKVKFTHPDTKKRITRGYKKKGKDVVIAEIMEEWNFLSSIKANSLATL